MTERMKAKTAGEFDQVKADRGEYTSDDLDALASAILYEDRADVKKVISDIQTEILLQLKKGESYPALVADQCRLSSKGVQKNMKKMRENGWIVEGKKEKNQQYWKLAQDVELPDFDDSNWMKESEMKDRGRVEIYNALGTADRIYVEQYPGDDHDPHVEETSNYWRTHPEGRDFRSKEERKENPRLSFYK